MVLYITFGFVEGSDNSRNLSTAWQVIFMYVVESSWFGSNSVTNQ